MHCDAPKKLGEIENLWAVLPVIGVLCADNVNVIQDNNYVGGSTRRAKRRDVC